MSETFQSALAILDEGLALYRRHFVAFLLITASWFVPVAIAIGLIIAVGTQLSEALAIILGLVAVLLLFPLLIYLVGGLSRAAVAAIDGRPVRIRQALAMPPSRVAGMGCFSLVYAFIAYAASSTLSLMCFCPLYIVGNGAFGGLATISNGNEVASVAAAVLFGIIFTLVYVVVLIISGATYSSLIYALQPWVHENRPFGYAFQRSFDLIGYRIGRNGIVWGTAAVLVASIGLTVTMAIGMLVPLPLFFVLGNESPVAQAIAATAWMLGFVFVLPPLPIWMALLYRRNVAAREGVELDARVQAWWQAHFGAPARAE